MNDFVCCADESADMNPRRNFFYGGFVARVEDWEPHLEAAWHERILARLPSIPYVHMTDMRSASWREKHGITQWQADQRLDEVARVIGGTGGLLPVVLSVGVAQFDDLMRPFDQFKAPKAFTATEEPDYLAFLTFAMSVIHLAKEQEPKLRKVHFWVERKQKVTARLEHLHHRMPAQLTELGWPELAEHVGEFRPIKKDCIRAQAADVVCWHARNYEKDTLDRAGLRRYDQMVDGHIGFRHDLTELVLRQLHERMETFVVAHGGSSRKERAAHSV